MNRERLLKALVEALNDSGGHGELTAHDYDEALDLIEGVVDHVMECVHNKRRKP